MNGKTRNICHSSSCIREPACRHPSSVFFANRFRSAACQKIQLPPGGSQEEVAGAGTIQFTHLFRKQQAASSRPYGCREKPVVRCVMNSHKILSYNPPLDKRCKICYLEAATEQYLQGGAKFPTGGDSPRTHLRRIGEIPIPTV